MAEQDVQGYALRSRCDLVCDGAASLEIVRWDGQANTINVDLGSARQLYRQAYREAEEAGFKFDWLRLQPQEKLVEIVRQSRESALEGEGGEENSES